MVFSEWIFVQDSGHPDFEGMSIGVPRKRLTVHGSDCGRSPLCRCVVQYSHYLIACMLLLYIFMYMASVYFISRYAC